MPEILFARRASLAMLEELLADAPPAP